MNKNIIYQIIILFFLTGCTSRLTEYPVLDDYSVLEPSVVIAVPQRVWELEPLKLSENCLSGEYICIDIDPPPLGFEYNIIKLIYGPSLPKTVEVATTSHIGIELYNTNKKTKKYPVLMVIGSKDDNYILPRNHVGPIVKLVDGNYVVPIDPFYGENTLWWFPCYITQEIKPIQFGESIESFSIPLEEASDEELKSKYAKIIGDKVVPTHGIYLKDIKAYLEKNAPKIEDFECDRD